MKDVKCPSCNGDNVKIVKKEAWNGVIGPGSYNWIKDQYYSCMNCGTRFDEV